MATVRIEVDRRLCMGAGECVYSAPHAFTLDEQNKAIVLKPELDSDDAVKAAVRGCPNFAIRLYPLSEDGTNR